ncbi:MAG: RNA-guided pseudouridylation complex pseudouridine synthase subunit Cbf5 [Thermoplasmata archaeon]|nr:MAG: RNA-guided pseudouridylation complex pseudouridine synthase subunit Cbf5 [Thermoplasmata archaeon]
MADEGPDPGAPPTRLVRAKARSDPAHGHPFDARPIADHMEYGIVVLDKPAGPSSHQVAAWARDAVGAKKAGHAGTLDPKVTGMLVVALDSGTRALDLVRQAGKEYVTELVLHKEVEKGRLRKTLKGFVGDVIQMPPKKSAVRRVLRTRRVYSIQLLEHSPRLALIRVHCEAGTYIRSLCHDIGQALGTGAHMGDLRRTCVGPFGEAEMVTLQDLRDAAVWLEEDGEEEEMRRIVRPMEELLTDLPRIVVRDSAVDALCHGAPLAVAGVLEVDETVMKGRHVAVFTGKGEAVGYGHATMTAEQMVEAKDGIAAELARVFMREGTYPRGWGKDKTPT